MQVIQGIEAARLAGVVLTIGNFDGVHRGHQALIARGIDIARRAGAQLAVMTFEPHPAAILNPDRVPPVLTPLAEKLRLLEEAGVGATVIVESRPAFFHVSAEDFVREVVVARFRPVALVEGDGFRFGRHRQGDIEMLRSVGRQHGFEVHTVEPFRAALGGHPDTVISSSLVRHLLGSGNVDHAALCLGRPYTLLGTVCRSAGRGRTLGFPTANLAAEGQLVPAEGVYVGVAHIRAPGASGGECGEAEGKSKRGDAGVTKRREVSVPAAISIGRAPTFDVHELLIEAHLLDFEGDLYGQPIRLDFLDWIRGQERFATVDALKEQMTRDVVRVRETATGRPFPPHSLPASCSANNA